MFRNIGLSTGLTPGEFNIIHAGEQHTVYPAGEDMRLVVYNYWRPDGTKSAFYILLDGHWWVARQHSDVPKETAESNLIRLFLGSLDNFMSQMTSSSEYAVANMGHQNDVRARLLKVKEASLAYGDKLKEEPDADADDRHDEEPAVEPPEDE